MALDKKTEFTDWDQRIAAVANAVLLNKPE